MKKKIVLMAAALLCCLAMSAQSMKMVVDSKGEVVGRLVRINADTYTVDVQDSYDVPKAGNRVVTYSAANGQGICYRHPDRRGNINVRKGPSTKTAVIAKIPDDDYLPECYPCLGKSNGWYKIRIDGKIGYVRQDLAQWDGMCTF
ncbi:MAG: SH3 domain-containing protein [Prevotella sp.]|nr:SH3 domain-containing protein [Prevotella sp.]